MKLVERINEAAQLRRLFLGAELEGLNGTSHDLPGRPTEDTCLGVERSPLFGDIRTINRVDAAMPGLYVSASA